LARELREEIGQIGRHPNKLRARGNLEQSAVNIDEERGAAVERRRQPHGHAPRVPCARGTIVFCATHTKMCPVADDSAEICVKPKAANDFEKGVDFEAAIPKLCGAVWSTCWFIPYVF